MWLAAGLAAGPAARSAARADRPAPIAAGGEVAELERVEQQITELADRLALVEREYGAGEDPSELLELRRRAAEAETQYLLGEWGNTAALLYDVVDAPVFRSEEGRPDALFYLADALFRQGEWLESRRTFLAVAALRVPRLQQPALLRLFELADKVNLHGELEELFRGLVEREGSLEKLKPIVVYTHAKWVSRRTDLPLADRIVQALAAFQTIPDEGEFGPQARFFEGALLSQNGALLGAAAAYLKLLALPDIVAAPGPAQAKPPAGLQGEAEARAQRAQRLSRLRDLATVALARVYYEGGDLKEAIERYSQIERESESYQDALYELSACWQRLGELDKAIRASELLLLVSEDSTLAPDARLQLAELQLKLKRYPQATALFEQIASDFRPVHQRIEQLTNVPDPIAYYDELLARGEKSLDTTQLLPEVARKFVSGRDAGKARLILEELALGRRQLEEAKALVSQLDQALKLGKLELFPTLQEGNLRSVELENGLVRLEGLLVDVETRLVLSSGGQVGARLQQARSERAALDEKVAQLPDNAAAFEERRRKALGRVGELERLAFRLGVEMDGATALLTAAEKWQRDTAAQRSKADTIGPAEAEQAEQEFQRRIDADRAVVRQLEVERQQLRQKIEVARASVASAVAGGEGEDRLRAQYLKALGEEDLASRALSATLPAGARSTEQRVQAAIGQLQRMRQRAVVVRASIRERATRRLLALRARLERETEVLGDFGAQVSEVEGGTKQLLGHLAFESFARVGRVFFDLVLKADLGVVDTAWAEKRDKSDSITALDAQKQRALRDLAEQFADVLREVE